jgi:hypothetical protein
MMSVSHPSRPILSQASKRNKSALAWSRFKELGVSGFNTQYNIMYYIIYIPVLSDFYQMDQLSWGELFDKVYLENHSGECG